MTNESTGSAAARARHAVCRFCAHPLRHTFVDLGMSPLCQTHIEPHELNHAEVFYPLHTYLGQLLIPLKWKQMKTKQAQLDVAQPISAQPTRTLAKSEEETDTRRTDLAPGRT